MAKCLAARDVEVTVLDNLSMGHREAMRWGDLMEADLMDPPALDPTFSRQRFDGLSSHS
jgi:UDP-glucose 4-epimerase